MGDQHTISLGYFVGRDGPSLYLETHSLEALQQLRELLLYLTEEEGRSVDLAQEPYIRKIRMDDDVIELVMESIPKKKERLTQLRKVKGESPGVRFRWRASQETWETISLFLDPFFDDDQPGHQYLSQGEFDEVGVEFSYKETSCEVPHPNS